MDTLTTDTTDNQTPDTLENDRAMDTLTTDHTRDTPIIDRSMDTQTTDATDNHCNQSCNNQTGKPDAEPEKLPPPQPDSHLSLPPFPDIPTAWELPDFDNPLPPPQVGKTRQKSNG